jgi:hypothetical protein
MNSGEALLFSSSYNDTAINLRKPFAGCSDVLVYLTSSAKYDAREKASISEAIP